MIIGVDLDNTIINYEKSFYKVALKEKLINKSYEYKGRLKLKKYIEKKENKKKWMQIQGLVYGKFIKFAEINQGFCKFLRLSKLRNIKIYIISHKTEFPYFNNQISLRKQSLEWLKSQKVFSKKYNLNKKNVFFTNNRKEKIEQIKLLKCDIFIDDLKLILQNIYFPKNCKKIHFSQTKNLISNNISVVNNWFDICNIIFGNLNNLDIVSYFKELNLGDNLKIYQLKSGGNSITYKVKRNNIFYALKIYPNKHIDHRPRLTNEIKTINFLKNNNFKNIPKIFNFDKDLNIIIFNWIAGSLIKKPILSDLRFFINFVKKLNSLSKNNLKFFPYASEACTSFNEIINQINLRFNKLIYESKSHKQLNYFLINEFKPLLNKIYYKSLKTWPKNNIHLNLNSDKLILNPSDLGFHNAIKSNNKIYLIDFEYFGKDDPVKLVSDFIWHPGNNLSINFKKKWKETMFKEFNNDKQFFLRFEASFLLYGMRFILIILNCFNQDFVDKISKVKNLNKTNQLLFLQKTRISKAYKIYKNINKQLN